MNIISSSIIKKPHWPWPFMDIDEVASYAAKNCIYMAKLGFFEIEDFDNWDVELNEAPNSKMLWINSLVSVHACLEASFRRGTGFYYEVGIGILKSYLSQYDGSGLIFKNAWTDEHAVANRLYVLTALIHDSAMRETKSISQLELLFHAERHAEWLYNDSHYVKNNHGVMMDLALLQFSLLIEGVDPDISSKYREKSLHRLSMMLSSTFLPDGYCTENSPSYHYVNFSLFTTIYHFLNKYNLEFDKEKWVNVLDKSKIAGELLLRSDGSIPLIGDSAHYPVAFFNEVKKRKKNGVSIYPNSGLFVFSSSDLHVTLRAGGTKFTHRHIDDLSVTLWSDGQEFICDGGLYNYDIKDRKRRNFISWRSHSGIFVNTDKKVSFKDFNSPCDMSRFTYLSIGEGEALVSAKHNLFPGTEVERKLSIKNDAIEVHDTLKSKENERWLCQYLLHPSVHVKLLEDKMGCVISSHDGKKVVIKFHCVGVDKANLRITEADYSDKFLNLQRTKKIVFSVEGDKGEVFTRIQLDGVLGNALLSSLKDFKYDFNKHALVAFEWVEPPSYSMDKKINHNLMHADAIKQSGFDWKVGPSYLEIKDVKENFIGLTVSSDIIYMRGVGSSGSCTLYSSSDGVSNVSEVYEFSEPILHMLSTPFGYFIQTRDYVYKSIDLKRWKVVFELPTRTFLRNGWDFDPVNKVIFFGEYQLRPGADVHVHCGFDEGEKWEIVYKFLPNEIRHIHAVQYDPFTGYIWLGTGDSDSQSRIYYTKDLFKSLNLVASGSQDYRVTSYSFTPERVIWGTDAPRVPQKIMYISRDNYASPEELKTCKDKPFYFSYCTNDNVVLLSSLSENITNIEKDGKNRIFAVKGYDVQEVFSMKIKEPNRWARLYPFGQDSNGFLYFCGVYMGSGPTNKIFRMRLNYNECS